MGAKQRPKPHRGGTQNFPLKSCNRGRREAAQTCGGNGIRGLVPFAGHQLEISRCTFLIPTKGTGCLVRSKFKK